MSIKELTLAKIADMVKGTLKGEGSYIVTSISAPESPCPGSISPLWEKKLAVNMSCDAVLLTKNGWIPENGQGIEVEDPRRALVTILEYFDTGNKTHLPCIHETAVISESSVIGDNVTIGPGCVVSDQCIIGDDCILEGNVWIGKQVSIGNNSRLEPGGVIYDRSSIGSNCIIHANAVIGCDGFGFMPDSEKVLLRIPQIGTVTIGDDVEIGVCSSIDRATFGETKIGKGTKIDSHVKIAHNCTVGEYCIIVAQAGVAGSSTLGRGVTMAAQSGVANHACIGDGVIAAGRAGITEDILPGSVVSGFPAIDHKKDLRQLAALRQLPDLIKNVKSIEKRLDVLGSGEK
ncbi:MAG: UDP-3-O-(3-hydroxymyristoyl)glucosamine N-acyltransferase [Synergistaceae bacterium]|nr:UDP-3-O-(3-hydroxymyristoyl)glucosamine N-acyltransferase [Synergistaceae bacterium]